MATDTMNAEDISLSEEAYEVLGCFSDELGEAVLRLATWIASQRADQGETIQVDRSDVVDASHRVIQAIERAIKEGNIPVAFEPVIEGTKKCLKETLDKK